MTLKTTKLGKELAKLRIDNELSRAKMAKELKMTDRELSLIEIGKSQVTDDFLMKVSAQYGSDKDVADSILDVLRDAHADSVKTITFDMTPLNATQRASVLQLKIDIDAENKVELENAEKLAKDAKRARARDRMKKLDEKKLAPVPAPEEAIAKEVNLTVEGLTEDDLSILAELEDLGEAV